MTSTEHALGYTDMSGDLNLFGHHSGLRPQSTAGRRLFRWAISGARFWI